MGILFLWPKNRREHANSNDLPFKVIQHDSLFFVIPTRPERHISACYKYFITFIIQNECHR